jgi:arabinose-5-phosphate isomerase
MSVKMYVDQIQDTQDSIEAILDDLVPTLHQKTVFMTGIGKSGHIARKCVATWQSLGISCHYFLCQDMLHGDIGVLHPNDIILYISNSGNTEELVPICSYIQNTFHTVAQILICNNKSPLLAPYVNKTHTIGNKKLIEADKHNFAPSVSSVIFMILLDLLAFRISETTTLDDIKRSHPGGSLGKK